jgi:hypothetical protein
MSTPKARPLKGIKDYDNSFLGNTVTLCRIKEIGETHWVMLGSCIDTPNSIEIELKNEKYQGKSVWIFDAFGGRRYHGLVQQEEAQ